MQTMLFLALLLCVLLHNSAMRSQQQQLCLLLITLVRIQERHYQIKSMDCRKELRFHRFTIDQMVVSHLTLHANLEATYRSLIQTMMCRVMKRRIFSKLNTQLRIAIKWIVILHQPFASTLLDSHSCMYLDAVDCLGKSLVTLRLLPLLHVALHSSSDAI